jgi:hypothetical protein
VGRQRALSSRLFSSMLTTHTHCTKELQFVQYSAAGTCAGPLQIWYFVVGSDKVKGKAVPLHTMEALGGRGSIAPTDSRPRH